MNARSGLRNLLRRDEHGRENFANLAHPTSGKKADEIRVACATGFLPAERLHHRMTDKDRAQSGSIIELSFEGKDAEHQVEIPRHLRDAATVPSPDLRA